MVDPSAPFSLWIVNSVFDSAESCNVARDALNQKGLKGLEVTKTEVGHRALQDEPDQGAAIVAIYEADTYSECIASDDPRLKEK
jgi:hypothetical protein